MNWAGNYTYRAARQHTPETLEQLQDLVARSQKVKVLGTRHSFNDIADTTEDLISLARFDKVVALDRTLNTVTVEAGIRYGSLAEALHWEGYALPNLASLPHISVAGACATATHGSGDRNGSLATSVTALEMVTASGEVVTLSRAQNPTTFPGAVVNLGALGAVTKLTLKIAPTFAIRQDAYENLPFATVETHFDEITSSAYSVSMFTDWRTDSINQVWRKSLASEVTGMPDEWLGATRATRKLHPLPDGPSENCTAQEGIPGPWHERLPHFRMDFLPSSGEELQSEYLIPRPHAIEALRAMYRLREQISPLLQISEVRTIAADDLWMSPFYRQDCIGIHLTWKKDWPAVSALLPQIEKELAPLDARPHWGKLFTMPKARLQSLYEKLPDFVQLLQQYDSQGKFRNAFLDNYLN